MTNDLGLPARFWSKVNKDGPVHPYNPELGKCWVWTAHCNDQGYGQFRFKNKTWKSHRLVLESKQGSYEGDTIHSCDNPPCVNPDHLSAGARQENINDMVNKGRQCKGQRTIQRDKGLMSNNTSGHKGVTWCKRNNKWLAQLVIRSGATRRRTYHLGYFENFEQACAAREAGELKYWKDKP